MDVVNSIGVGLIIGSGLAVSIYVKEWIEWLRALPVDRFKKIIS